MVLERVANLAAASWTRQTEWACSGRSSCTDRLSKHFLHSSWTNSRISLGLVQRTGRMEKAKSTSQKKLVRKKEDYKKTKPMVCYGLLLTQEGSWSSNLVREK